MVHQGVQGLDFERYLQPAVRCSLSPRATTEMSDAADVEMESPAARLPDITQEDMMSPGV